MPKENDDNKILDVLLELQNKSNLTMKDMKNVLDVIAETNIKNAKSLEESIKKMADESRAYKDADEMIAFARGPKGEKGDKGDKGDPGEDGKQGPEAKVDYKGIIEAVLNKITLPKDGKDGKDGKPGKDGKNGKDGIGRPGKDGKDGKNGKDGKSFDEANLSKKETIKRIVGGIETLKDSDRLDYNSLKNTPNLAGISMGGSTSSIPIQYHGNLIANNPTALNFIGGVTVQESFGVITLDIQGNGGGGTGGGGNIVVDQTPDNGTYSLLSGDVDGVNTTFTVSTAEYVSGKLTVALNGQILEQGATEDWVETDPSTGTFDFVTPPTTGDVITAIYQSTPLDGVYLESVVAGSNITIDNTDPQNPIISATGGGGGAVDSVNGQTGVVVLDADDIDDASTTHKFVTSTDLTKLSNLSGTNSGDVTTTDSSEIDFTLTGQDITASLITGSIDVLKLDSGVQTSLGLADTSVQPNTTPTLTGITISPTGGNITGLGTVNLDVLKARRSAGIFIQSLAGTNIGLLGAGDTANATWYGTQTHDLATASRIAIFDASKVLVSADTATYPSLTELSYVKGVTSAIQTQLNTKLTSSSTITDGFSKTFVGTGANGTYTLRLKMPFAGTITETVSISGAGTATAQFKINTTNLGGTANSVSTSEQSQSHASANAFSAGDDIVVEITSASSLANMVLSVTYTRALA